MEVSHAEGALSARFGKEDLGKLVPWEYDSFRGAGSTTVTFQPDGAGRIASLRAFGITFRRSVGTP